MHICKTMSADYLKSTNFKEKKYSHLCNSFLSVSVQQDVILKTIHCNFPFYTTQLIKIMFVMHVSNTTH